MAGTVCCVLHKLRVAWKANVVVFLWLRECVVVWQDVLMKRVQETLLSFLKNIS